MNDSTINKIHFNKYKRYDNQDVEFKPGVTAIAGTNGTCKSSLLHIISNSYQECKKDIFDSSNDALKIITSLLTSTNPKLESLNRGDREFNDPAERKHIMKFIITMEQLHLSESTILS